VEERFLSVLHLRRWIHTHYYVNFPTHHPGAHVDLEHNPPCHLEYNNAGATDHDASPALSRQLALYGSSHPKLFFALPLPSRLLRRGGRCVHPVRCWKHEQPFRGHILLHLLARNVFPQQRVHVLRVRRRHVLPRQCQHLPTVLGWEDILVH